MVQVERIPFHPRKSVIRDETLAEFIRAGITGTLTEVMADCRSSRSHPVFLPNALDEEFQTTMAVINDLESKTAISLCETTCRLQSSSLRLIDVPCVFVLSARNVALNMTITQYNCSPYSVAHELQHLLVLLYAAEQEGSRSLKRAFIRYRKYVRWP